jgi:hypothetical protein
MRDKIRRTINEYVKDRQGCITRKEDGTEKGRKTGSEGRKTQERENKTETVHTAR